MARKRAQKRALRWGDGYITERAQKDGIIRYQARWSEPAPDNEMTWRSRTFATLADAESHLRTIGQHKRDGSYTPESELTVAELVADYLDHGAHRWTANTAASYGQVTKTHLLPYLGDLRTVELTPRRVQVWLDDLLRAGLGGSTINNARIVLSGACKDAVRLGIIAANPVAGARVPTRRRTAKTIWSREDAMCVLATVQDDPVMHAFYTTALTTGMRPGELRALQWADIDATRRTIRCARTMTRDAQFRVIVGETTKTHRTRIIAVPAETIAALHALRTVQLERRLATRGWEETDLVFDRGNGRFLPLTTLERWHEQAIARAGVLRIRLHDLRHTAATLLLEAGVDVKVVSSILGHASTTTTRDTYQHVREDLQREAIERISDLLREG